MNAVRHRTLLRAVLSDGHQRFVAHLMEMSGEYAFISTHERPPIGASFNLELSLRSLVSPVNVRGEVIAYIDARDIGDPTGIQIRFDTEDPEQRAMVRALLAILGGERGSERPPKAAYRVLLVEDSRMIGEVFACGVNRHFEGSGADVTIDVVGDGEQAWQLLQKEHFDLAIVDHYLPVLDGTTLVAKVRADPKLCEMPVVGVSVGGASVRTTMLAAGADLFLDKPVLLDHLLTTLDRLAGAHRTEEA